MATKAADAGIQHGWRSGLEEQVAEWLDGELVDFDYEKVTLPFTQPLKPRKYTPDFVLWAQGFIVETKGRFVTADRQKQLLVQAQHPDIEIRLLFSRPNERISKTSSTTYASWCEKHGFRYARSTPKDPFPATWLTEPCNAKSRAAIKRLLGV